MQVLNKTFLWLYVTLTYQGCRVSDSLTLGKVCNTGTIINGFEFGFVSTFWESRFFQQSKNEQMEAYTNESFWIWKYVHCWDCGASDGTVCMMLFFIDLWLWVFQFMFATKYISQNMTLFLHSPRHHTSVSVPSQVFGKGWLPWNTSIIYVGIAIIEFSNLVLPTKSGKILPFLGVYGIHQRLKYYCHFVVSSSF